jgi:hypothetical protein
VPKQWRIMEAEIRIDTNYYEFLDLVKHISKNSVSIQTKLIKTIYENYDIQKVKNDLDKKIAYLNRLIAK